MFIAAVLSPERIKHTHTFYSAFSLLNIKLDVFYLNNTESASGTLNVYHNCDFFGYYLGLPAIATMTGHRKLC